MQGLKHESGAQRRQERVHALRVVHRERQPVFVQNPRGVAFALKREDRVPLRADVDVRRERRQLMSDRSGLRKCALRAHRQLRIERAGAQRCQELLARDDALPRADHGID